MSTNWDDFTPVNDAPAAGVDWSQFEPVESLTDTGDETARLAKRFPAPSRGGKRNEVKPFVAGTAPTQTEFPIFREAGNIDLGRRPQVKNADGSISTVRSMSANIDGDEVLLPTVSDDGRIMTDDEAVAQYRKTGRHLGKFADARSADLYAKNLHDEQEAQYLRGEKPTKNAGRGTVNPPTIAQMKTAKQAETPRTWGEAVMDTTVALAKGGNSVMSLPLALIAPGGTAYNWVKENGKAIEEMESPTVKAQRKQIAEMLAKDPNEMAKFATSLRESLLNPAIAFSTMVEQLPVMGALLATGGAGALIGRAAVTPIGVGAITSAAGRIGASAGMATGGAVGAGGDAASDTFDRLMNPMVTPISAFEQNPDYAAMVARGATPEQARRSIAESKSKLAAALAAPLGAISGLVGLKVPGTGSVVGKGGVAAGGAAVLKELGGEVVEELGTKASGNFAVQTVDPRQSLTEGFGETAAQTIIGAGGPSVLAGLQHGLPPVKAEDMPADRVLTPEELATEAAKADAIKAAQTVAAAQNQPGVPGSGVGGSQPTAAPPSLVVPEATVAAPPAGDRIGVGAVQQGSLADRVDQANAEQGNGRQGGVPESRVGAVGVQGAPDAGGSVVVAGRAAGEPEGQVAGANAPADSAPVAGSTSGGANAARVTELGASYESKRQTDIKAAEKLEKQSSDWAAVGLTDKAEKAAEKAKAKRRSAGMMPVVLEPTPGPALDQVSTLFDALERVTGHRPVAYSSGGKGSIDGFYDSNKGVTAVDVSSAEMPVPFTVFHEFTHRMQDLAKQGDESAKAAEKMLGKVWEMISPEGKRAYAEKYLFKSEGSTVEEVLADPKKLTLLRREMLADFMGGRAMDKRFMRKLAKREPETFGEFAKQWIKVLTDLIADLKGKGRPGVKNVDQYIAKLEEAKSIAEEALVEWSKTNKTAESGSEGISASPRGANRSESSPLPPIDFDESEMPDLPSFREARGSPMRSDLRKDPESLGGKPPDYDPNRLPRGFNIDADENFDSDWADDEPIPTGTATEMQTVEDAIDMIGKIRGLSPEKVVEEYGYREDGDYIKLAEKLIGARNERRRDAMFPSIEGLALSEDEVNAQIRAELSAEGYGISIGGATVTPAPRAPERSEPIRTVNFAGTTDEQIKAMGIMAESAYPDPQYRLSGYELVAEVTLKEGDIQVSLTPKEGRKKYSNAFDYPRHALERAVYSDPSNEGMSGVGAPNFGEGANHLGTEQSKKLAKIFTASVDLYGRRFDLFTSIPKEARKRVEKAWKTISGMSGAFEFNKIEGEFLGGDPGRKGAWINQTQDIADKILAGTKYTARVYSADLHGAGSVDVVMYDTKTGKEGTATIEYAESRGKGKFIMHTAGFQAGSSMGKPFYQIAFGLANVLGDIPVEADGILLGMNTYRRTEQMMSAAARSGRSSAVRPGIGQRIYGWNRRPKNEEQESNNFVRTALAQARNTVEFVPEMVDLSYDLSTDKFSWRNGDSAEDFVTRTLDKDASPDNRRVSMSRSTMARAAVTLNAIDGTLSIDENADVASPVLYSAREPADLSNPLGPDYAKLDGRKLKYEVRVADTGDVATLTVDARAAMTSLDSRLETMRNLITCLGR